MRRKRYSIPVEESTAEAYRRRCRQLGCKSVTEAMAAALHLFARLMTEPLPQEWEALGTEIEREFGELSEAESYEWNNKPHYHRRR